MRYSNGDYNQSINPSDKMSLFIIIATTIVAIILSKLAIWFFKFLKFFVAVNKLPGPAMYPLPTINFQINKVKLQDRLKWFSDLSDKYESGIVMTTASFNEVVVFLSKPRHLEVIFPSTENITKTFAYDNFNLWLGKGLLTSTGEKWFHQRKILTPAFHFGVVDRFSEIMSEKAEILIEIIEKKVKENPERPIEFFTLAIRCALDTICETSMGVNMNVQRNHDSEYITALHKVAEISIKRTNYPWLKWNSIFYRTKLGLEFKSAIDTMTNFSMQIIKKRQQARRLLLNSNISHDNGEDEIGKRKKKAFLDLLLDVNENEKIPMTDTELREEVDTFMFAGHDTTAAAISWTIFNLGNNLDIQEKVHHELNEVFGDSKEPAKMKQLAQLNCLDRVIKESLRLNPSVPRFGRLLTEDIELDGYIIPKGCNVTISTFDLHRDPEIWPNPLIFDPDRFLPENCRGRHPYAYVPFSAGPRNCIGQKFAMAELKVVLTAILRKWRVKSARTQEEMKMHASLILRPHDGNPVYFIKK